MNKRLCLSIILCFITLFLTACIFADEENAIIKDKDGAFDTTVDELVNILNSEIQKENLVLIPTEYEELERSDAIIYKFRIDDKYIIWFVDYLGEGSGINRIGITFIDEMIKYEDPLEGDGNIICEASEDIKSEAIKYYEAICSVLKPKFKAENFIRDEEDNTTSIEYDKYVFHTSSVGTFNDTDNVGQTTITYEVISSKDVYDKHKEEIEDGDDVDFK